MKNSRSNLYSKIKNNNRKNRWTLIIGLVLLGIFLFYCFLRPNDTGILGQTIDKFLMKVMGITKFFIPFIIFYWIWYNLKSKTHQIKTKIYLILILTILFSGLVKITLKILELPLDKINYFSGWLGNTFLEIMERIFGNFFSSLIVLISFIYVLTTLFEVSIYDIFYEIYFRIKKDIEQWMSEIKFAKKVVGSASRYEKRSGLEEEKRDHLIFKSNNIENNLDIQQQIKNFKQTELKKEHQQITVLNKKSLVEKKEVIKETERIETSQEYKLPHTELLSIFKNDENSVSNIKQQAEILENLLKEFNINAKVVDVSLGPVVTMYEIELEPGIKVQSVATLKDNIALGMKTHSIRIISSIPGKGTIGIEIPNPKPQIVYLREILESEDYKNLSKKMILPITIGKTVDGKPCIDDIAPMPHLLIAGSTGSGKSVCLHSIIISLLYKCSADYMKLVLIDPKRLELMYYNGIPHLYDPTVEPENVKVITSSKDAAKVLSSLVKVMELRYEKFASCNVRNIEGYNDLMRSKNLPPEFYIVVIIDEFADLILTVPKEVEDAIQRLAQMARAVGIHLVLATQRPSVDVITGVIKANFSSRIAFQVLSKTDSRVILDITGAEELLGKGDMLYLATGSPKPIRLQGTYVSDKDIINVVNFIRSQNIKPKYENILRHSSISQQKVSKEKEEQQKEDLYSALLLIKERKRISQDLLKAHFKSSAKATDILSLLEVKGFIYKPEGTNKWNINFDRVEEMLKLYEENAKIN